MFNQLIEVSSSFKEQQVTISVKDLDDVTRDTIYEIVDEDDVLVFEENATPVPSTVDQRYENYYYPMPGGAYYHAKSGSSSVGCTISFSVKKNLTPYLLTSGHCLDGKSGWNIWQGVSWNSVAIGTASTESFYNGTTADAGLIQLTDPDMVSSWILGNSAYSVNALIGSDWLNDYEGLLVCSSLGKTDTSVCGEVLNTDADIVVTPSYYWLNNQKEISISVVSGDSGSPVYAPCSGCGNNVGIYGIVAAGGSTMYASYISNIHSALGVVTIKNDNDPITILD